MIRVAVRLKNSFFFFFTKIVVIIPRGIYYGMETREEFQNNSNENELFPIHRCYKLPQKYFITRT